MIESLKLINFQAHRKILLEFDPGVTTIVGRTDAGKSSLLRALRWAALNKAPSDFITHGKEQATVQLVVDGKTIIRRKGKKNSYQLDELKFFAVKSDVPDSIAKVLNVNVNNFHRQLDGPFWFDKTPGQVSKELNQIVNLGIIDEAVAHLSSLARRSKTEIEICRSRLQTARKQKKELAWVPDMLVAAERLQGLIDLAATITATVARQRLLLTNAVFARKTYRKVRRGAVACGHLLAIGKSILGMRTQHQTLFNLIEEIERKEKELCELKQEQKTNQAKLKQVKICPVCGQPLKL